MAFLFHRGGIGIATLIGWVSDIDRNSTLLWSKSMYMLGIDVQVMTGIFTGQNYLLPAMAKVGGPLSVGRFVLPRYAQK